MSGAVVRALLLFGFVLALGSVPAAAQYRLPPVQSISIDSPSVVEGAPRETTSLVFTITMDRAATEWAWISFWSAQGTATWRVDFTDSPEGFWLGPGGSRTVAYRIIGDDDIEEDETVDLRFIASINGRLTGPYISTGKILNDDKPELSIQSASVHEGSSMSSSLLMLPVTLAPAATRVVTVDYAVTGETAEADSDYQATSGSLTFNPGETEKTIEVTVVGDDRIESAETMAVTLSNPTGGAVIRTEEGTGTIVNDDGLLLSIDSPSVAEGATGTTPLVFTVTLASEPPGQVTVNYAVGGTASNAEDYVVPASTGTLRFGPGNIVKTITVMVMGDGVAEPDETVAVTLSNPTGGARIETGTGTGVIGNDDFPVLSIDSPSVAEGAQGERTPLVFTVALDRMWDREVRVDYWNTLTGTGSYQRFRPGTLRFAPGQTLKTITVTVYGDDSGYSYGGRDKTVVVELSNLKGGAKFGKYRGIGTILDDDKPRFSVRPASVREGSSTSTPRLAFPVTLSPAAAGTVTVAYAVTGGTATAGVDFRGVSGTLTFAPNETSQTIEVAVIDDNLHEPDETVVVSLSNPAGGTELRTGRGTGTIVDDDDLILSVDSPHVAEGATGTTPLVFTVTLDQVPHQVVTVDYVVGGTATNGQDYAASASGGTLRFEPGDTEKTITVMVNGDRRHEPDETVVVELSRPTGRAVIGSGTGTGLIGNDDPLPTLSIDSPSVFEGAQGETPSLVFTVTMDRESDREVRVQYWNDWRFDTASGNDYRGGSRANGTLVFAPGETSKTITVPVYGDDRAEGNETVIIELTRITGEARLGVFRGTGTILDEGGRQFWFPSRHAGVHEGSSSSTSLLVFPVMLSPAATGTVTVDYAVVDGTATAGSDYQAVAPGTLTFAPGETRKTIEVVVNGDDTIERDEGMTVVLSNPTDGIRISEGTMTGRILKDENFEFLVDSPSVDEGAPGGAASLVFTVTLPRSVEGRATVEYWEGVGSAEKGADYRPIAPGRLVFGTGETEKRVEVAVNGDDRIEGDETVVLRFRAYWYGGWSSTRTVTGKIRDDDGARLSIDSPSVREGSSTSSLPLAFTVTLSPAATGTVTVGYAVTGGTATAGTDYGTVAPGMLRFLRGETSKTIEVAVNGDRRVEPDETVTVALSDPTGKARIRTGEGTGTIEDDDDFTLSIDSPNAIEGATGTTPLVFTVTLASEPPVEMTVDYQVAAGSSATEGDDYGAVAPGTLRFEVGETVKTIEVTVNGDRRVEPDETVVVELSNPEGGARIGTGTGTGTIGDDDRPPVLSIDSPGAAEGAGRRQLVFTVTLDRESDREVTVDYREGGGTARGWWSNTDRRYNDYERVADGTLRFEAGETSKTIPVMIIGDTNIENDETVVVELLNPTGGARIGTGRGTGTILNDDSPGIRFDGVEEPRAYEGSSMSSRALMFPLSLTRSVPGTVTVDYAVSGGTATAGTDYQAATGTVTFEPGDTRKTIEVTINGDDIVEQDEWMLVELSNSTGWSYIHRNVRKGWIRDDDVLRPSIKASEVAEGTAGTTAALAFTVALDQAPERAASIKYEVTGGTAVAGTDYKRLVPGTLTFAPGEDSKMVSVTVLGDASIEDDETVLLRLQPLDRDGQTTGTYTVTGKILDDDRPRFSVQSARVREGSSTSTPRLAFPVTLSPAAAGTVTVAYAVTGGTATPGADFRTASGTLTFAPNEISQTIEIAVIDDNLHEADETVTVELSNPTGGSGLRTGEATGTIEDDDDLTLSIDSPSVDEGAVGTTPLVFTVTLASESPAEVTVGWTVTDGGTAEAGADFQAVSGTLAFAPGDTVKTVTVMVLGDGAIEPDETVTVELSTPTGGAAVRPGEGTGTGTIRDDDTPAFSVDSPGVDEGAAGERTPLVFTVTLEPEPDGEVSVDYRVEEGTAAAGDDYGAVATGTLTFAAGETSKTITVTVNGDHYTEGDDTVVVVLSNPSNGTRLGTDRGTGTIRNDDWPGFQMLAEPDALEGSPMSSRLLFWVRVFPVATGTVAADYEVTVGTSTAVIDPRTASGRLTFEPGDVQTFDVAFEGAATAGRLEWVEVEFSNPSGIDLAERTMRVPVRGYPKPLIDVRDVAEGAAGATTALVFTVTLGRAPERTVSIEYEAAGGTAVAGADYMRILPGTLTFEEGQRSRTVVVTVNGDDLIEENETVALRFHSLSRFGRRIGTYAATGTIRNDDRPRLSVGPASVREGSSTSSPLLVFPVTLDPAVDGTVTVDWAAAGGTAVAGTDYQAASGTLAFASGDTSRTIEIQVHGDNLHERDETLLVALSDPTGDAEINPGAGTATGTIVNDDALTLSIAPPAPVSEGDTGTTALVFTVELASESLDEVTVDYAVTAESTAEAGADYRAATGTLAFAPGDMVKTVEIEIHGDNLHERDETVTVALSGPTGGASIAPGEGTGTGIIKDDDDLTLSINSLGEVSEGAAGATTALVFTVTLASESSNEVTVGWAVTGEGTVKAGVDFQAASGTLVFMPGERRKTIKVVVNGDDIVEEDERVTVALSSPTGGASIENAIGRVLILDDDIHPTFSVKPSSVAEGAAGATSALAFTVTLDQAPERAAMIGYWVRGGTAEEDIDYRDVYDGPHFWFVYNYWLPNRIWFTTGETSKTITITINGDDDIEGDETLVVEFQSIKPSYWPWGEPVTVTGTIRNDDWSELSVQSASVREGSATSSPSLVFPVTLTPAASGTVTVSYAVTGGTATAGADYRAATGTLTFEERETSRTIEVAVVGDNLHEPDETVLVTLSDPTGAAVIGPGAGTGTGTILDDDELALSIGPSAPVSEGATGTASLAFPVTLASESLGGVTVEWAAAGGTATAGADYRAATGTLAFAPGDTSGTIEVEVVDDNLHEPDETVTVALSAPTGGAGILTGEGTGVILDDDELALSIDSPSAAEGDAGATPLAFTVELASESLDGVTVEWAAAGVTAEAGADFRAATGTLAFAPGDTSGTVTVSVLGDGAAEPDETLEVRLSGPTGGASIAPGEGTGTGTILNDDLPVLSIDPPSAVEGGPGVTATLAFTARLSAPWSRGELSVGYSVEDGTAEAGSDYAAVPPGTLTFRPGETERTIGVEVAGDARAESDETVVVRLSGPTGGLRLAADSFAGTIRNDDLLGLWIWSAGADEGSATSSPPLAFTVALAQAVAGPVAVDWATTGGTAAAGEDYLAASGTVEFAPGETRRTIEVAILGDDAVEGDETVEVTLSNPAGGATVLHPTGSGTIRNDDRLAPSIDSPSVAEGGPGGTTPLVFTVSLGGSSDREAAAVYWAEGGSASAGSDYRPLATGLLTFEPGATSAAVEVEVEGDAEVEEHETVVLKIQFLGPPGGGPLTGTGTILDDDRPRFSIGSAAAREGPAASSSRLSFTVELSPAAAGAATVDWTASGGTAEAGADFRAATGTLAFAPGDAARTVEVEILGDDLHEGDETVVVRLSGATGGARVRTGEGTGTILDDDELALSVDSPRAVEGATGTTALAFTVGMASRSSGEVSVDWALAGGTAAAGSDYTAPASGTLRFAPGETSRTIGIAVKGDRLHEPDETVSVRLSGATGGAWIRTGEGTGTIVNDDELALSIDSPSVAEGATGTASLAFTVSLASEPSAEVAVGWAASGVTAAAGEDFEAATGTLRFAPGETSRTVAVAVLGDDLHEGDETVVVRLSGPTGGASIAAGEGTGTILDDDELALSIDSPSVAEGASGTTTLAFTVSLAARSSGEVAVGYAVGGTAAAGADYEASAAGGTLVFAPGERSKRIAFAVLGDAAAEPDETVTVELSGPTGGASIAPGAGMGTGTIVNDDLPVLSVDSPSADEGAPGDTTPLTFTARLSAPWSGWDLSVDYRVGGGTAEAGVDYAAAATGTLTFRPGETERTIEVMVSGDGTTEFDETVEVSFLNPTGGLRIGTAAGTGTIRNDDLVRLSIWSDAAAAEGDGSSTTTLSFSVALFPPASVPVAVGWASSGGTAAAGSDYEAASGTLVFAPGDIFGKIGIQVNGDDIVEEDETVTVSLSGPGGWVVAENPEATGTIVNDDLLEVSVDSPEADEGAAGERTPLTFTVSLERASDRAVAVGYLAVGGTATANTDYRLVPGTLTIEAGATSGTVSVEVIGDGEVEEHETVVLWFRPAGRSELAVVGKGRILDDDGSWLSIGSASAREGSSTSSATLAFAVELAPAAAVTVTVGWASSDGTAKAGADYRAATGTLVFAPGEGSGTVEVEVLGDGLHEPDETLTVRLSEATGGARIRTGEGTGTIVNDDALELSIDSPSVLEGATGTASLAFTVSLAAEAAGEVTVGYAVSGGTAAAGEDYAAVVPGTLEFAPGDASRTIEVEVNGDRLHEPDETVTVRLSDATGGAGIRTGEGTGTIVNDDVLELSIDSPSVEEGAAGATTSLVFTVELASESSGEVSVDWTVAGGTAEEGSDYAAAASGGTLRFEAGETSKGIAFAVLGDGDAEPDETLEVALSGPTGGASIAAGAGTGTGTIRNDDFPVLSVEPPSVHEGDPGETATLSFTARLSAPWPEELSVGYVVKPGTAEAGSDYRAAAPGRLVFAAGSVEGTVEVAVNGDDEIESDETVALELSDPSGGLLLGAARVEGTIRNDEPLGFSVLSRGVDEGSASSSPALTFTVALTRAVNGPVGVDWATAAGGTAEAGIDYEEASGRIEFEPGRALEIIKVPVLGDDIVEGDETVAVELSNPTGGATLGQARGEGTIRDDDRLAPSIDSPGVAEGAAGETLRLAFTLSLGRAADEEVPVFYWGAGGTAGLGVDYRPVVPGLFTFGAGSTSTTVEVEVVGDAEEEDDETVLVQFQVLGRFASGPYIGTGTILDDDRPRFSVDSPSVREGAASSSTALVFTVELAPESGAAATVDWMAVGGTATAGEDFEAAAGTLAFAPGETSRTIEVSVAGDGAPEPDETVEVVLSKPTGGTGLRTGVGVGVIVDDDLESAQRTSAVLAAADGDGGGALSIDSPTADEGRSGTTTSLAFTVTLDREPVRGVTVGYEVTGGTAASGEDYAAVAPGTLAFAPGETSKTIPVAVIGDDREEADETVEITLSAPTGGARVATSTGTGMIRDAGPAPRQDAAERRRRTGELAHALTGVGRALASHVVDLVWARAESHRSGGGEGTQVAVGGRTLDTGAFAGGAEGGRALRAAGEIAGLLGIAADSPEALLRGAERRLSAGRSLDSLRGWADLPSDRELAGRSGFEAAFGGEGEDGSAGLLTVWGRGGFASFRSKLEDGELTADGDVTSVHLGFDYRSGGGLLAGVATGRSLGDVEYGEGRGGVRTELTSLHPYLHWMSPGGLGVWGAAGYGAGSAEAEDGSGAVVETGLAMRMAAAGVRDGLAELGGIGLAAKADAFAVRSSADGAEGGAFDFDNADADASRVRAALEGTSRRELEGGGVFAGRFELGARLDGGDAGQGAGADIAAGFEHSVPRLGLELEGRGSLLLVHEEGGFREWGLGLGLTYDPGAGGRGVQVSLEPSWGAPSSNAADSMWNAKPGALGGGRSSGGPALDARIGYGMGVLGGRGLVTVFGEIKGDGDRLRIGAGVGRPGAGAGGPGLELYGERQDRSGRPDHSINLKGRLVF